MSMRRFSTIQPLILIHLNFLSKTATTLFMLMWEVTWRKMFYKFTKTFGLRFCNERTCWFWPHWQSSNKKISNRMRCLFQWCFDILDVKEVDDNWNIIVWKWIYGDDVCHGVCTRFEIKVKGNVDTSRLIFEYLQRQHIGVGKLVNFT